MSCQSCANLLVVYNTKEPLYEHGGLQDCDEMVDVCKRSARNRMNFMLNASGAVGGDALLASKEAARLARECQHATDALLAHLHQEHADLVGKAGSSTRLPL